MRKAKRLANVTMEFSPGSSFYPVSEEEKARFRHHSLLQDYQELTQETEAKRKQLQKAQRKKLRLLAEVRFLRRKYNSLLKNPSGIKPYRLKKKPQSTTSQSTHNGQSSKPATISEASRKDQSSVVRETAIAITSTVIDLNQVSLPSGEEMEGFQVNWELPKIDKLKKCSIDGDAMANDMKFPICRDVGNGSSRLGKRKITWQDQVVLKV